MTVFHYLKHLLAEVFPFRFCAAKIQSYNAQLVFLLNFLSTSMYLFSSGPSKDGELIFLLHFLTLFSLLRR